MKTIVRSIKPYWLYLILIGKKEIEIGKSRPRSSEWDELVYLYCAKDMKSFNRIPKEDRAWMRKFLGKIAGHFFCGRIEEIHQFILDARNSYERDYLDTLLDKSCLSYEELTNYLKGREYYKPFYIWHISAFIRAKPFDISRCGIKRPPQSWQYVAA